MMEEKGFLWIIDDERERVYNKEKEEVKKRRRRRYTCGR